MVTCGDADCHRRTPGVLRGGHLWTEPKPQTGRQRPRCLPSFEFLKLPVSKTQSRPHLRIRAGGILTLPTTRGGASVLTSRFPPPPVLVPVLSPKGGTRTRTLRLPSNSSRSTSTPVPQLLAMARRRARPTSFGGSVGMRPREAPPNFDPLPFRSRSLRGSGGPGRWRAVRGQRWRPGDGVEGAGRRGR